MWEVRFNNNSGDRKGFYTLSKIPEEDESSRSSTYVIPWTDRVCEPLNGYYNIAEVTGVTGGTIDFESEDYEDVKTDANSWINVEESSGLPVVNSEPFSSDYKDFYETSEAGEKRSLKVETVQDTKRGNDNISDQRSDEIDLNRLYGNHGTILMAFFVRLLLIGHNFLTVWRVTEAYNENFYWLFAVADFILIFECIIVAVRNGGTEYSWWCPCLLMYLASTIPPIWLLQLHQRDLFVDINKISAPTSTEPVEDTFNISVWVIVIEESLVYLLVFSRWLLPRGKVSRDFFAYFLIEVLAIASDIMEFLALFDENVILGNRKLTYVVLAVWSASFVQFVPVYMLGKSLRKAGSPDIDCINRKCRDKFIEVMAICLSLFLHDLPFLVVRLYVIIKVELITYSLIFFLMKNIAMFLLLSCRLAVLSYRLQCCKGIREQETKNAN